MEAKDTTKTYGELKTYCADKGIYEPTELDLREAQAEISFKAGIREVVEWFDGHRGMPIQQRHPDSRRYYHCEESEWQAKWGIDTG